MTKSGFTFFVPLKSHSKTFLGMKKPHILTKDESRVERSISSIMKKIEMSMALTHPRTIENERVFEQSCYDAGLIYFPSTFATKFM